MNKKQSKNKFNVVNDNEKNLMEKWQNESNDEKIKRYFILNRKWIKNQFSLNNDEYYEWNQLHDWVGNYLVNKDLKEQEKNNNKGNKNE